METEHGRRILRHTRGNPETEVSRSLNHRATLSTLPPFSARLYDPVKRCPREFKGMEAASSGGNAHMINTFHINAIPIRNQFNLSRCHWSIDHNFIKVLAMGIYRRWGAVIVFEPPQG